MSLFLAPIHTWLFNKILILENIEKEIVTIINDEKITQMHQKLLVQYGDFIPDEPLENLIDQTNIHGWLQERITLGEIRQAALVNALVTLDEKNWEKVKTAYYNVGGEVAPKSGNLVTDPAVAFEMLNNVLLEGMPCDRVNKVVEQTANKITWVTTSCVHKANWESENVPVENFYRFKEAFTQGFVKAINENMIYTYEMNPQQTHQITI